MELFSLEDLFVHDLRDLHSAETAVSAELPRLIAAADHPGLRQALEACHEAAQSHQRTLAAIFIALGESPEGKECRAIAALLEADRALIARPAAPAVLDAALIGAAQRMIHYKIAGYGCLRAYASLLARADDRARLEQLLEEEKACDRRMIAVAGQINVEALEEG